MFLALEDKRMKFQLHLEEREREAEDSNATHCDSLYRNCSAESGVLSLNM